MAIRSEAYRSLQVEASENCTSGTPRALLILSSVLERSIQKNDKLLLPKRKNDPVTIFHGLKAPNLSITRYMERIFKYARCSPSCFVIAQIYMDRYFQKKGGGYLTSYNAHRLLITSVMVAAKFADDEYCSNAYYAQVGGVSTEEMNKMELEFLFNLEFRLFVTTDMFVKCCEKLDKVDVGEYQIHRPISRYAK